MALQTYLRPLQGTRYKASAQQICGCVRVLSFLLQEKKKEGFTDTKYQHNKKSEEEYIDLIPILKDLYIDVVHFLKPIKEVRLAYGQN